MLSKPDPLNGSHHTNSSYSAILQSRLFPFFLSAVLAATGVPYLVRTANIDEGMYLLYAQQLVDRGGKPYDDVVILKNPGIVIVHLLCYALLHDPKTVLFLVRTLNWLLFAGSILGVYFIAKTVFSEKAGLFGAILFATTPAAGKLLINNTMEPGLIFFQTWSLFFAVRALSPEIMSPGEKNRLFLVSGCFAALSFLFKETAALVVLFSLTFFLAWGFKERTRNQPWSPFMLYILGGILGSIPLLAFLLYYNCFWEFLNLKIGIISLIFAKAAGNEPSSSAVGPVDANYGKIFAESLSSFAEAPLLWIAGFLGLALLIANSKRSQITSIQIFTIGFCLSSIFGTLGSVLFNSGNVDRYLLPVIAILVVFSGNWLAIEFEERDTSGLLWFLSIWIGLIVITFFLVEGDADLGSPFRELLLIFQGGLLVGAIIVKKSKARRFGSRIVTPAHLSLGLWGTILLALFVASTLFSAQAANKGIQSYQEYFAVASYVADRTADDEYIFSDVPIVLYLSQRRQAFNITVMIRMSWRRYVNFSDIPRFVDAYSVNYVVLTDFFFLVFPEDVVEHFASNFKAVRRWDAGPNDYLRGAIYLRIQ
ncbi:MAG: ArnT family glycosyltransferase [Candidatus Thorarchaeota archaeon]